MNEEQARELAIEILDEFEELLAEKNIQIPSVDREGREEEACIYGEEYYRLEDAIVAILTDEPGDERSHRAEGMARSDKRLPRGGIPRDSGVEVVASEDRRSREAVDTRAALDAGAPQYSDVDWDFLYECTRDKVRGW